MSTPEMVAPKSNLDPSGATRGVTMAEPILCRSSVRDGRWELVIFALNLLIDGKYFDA